MAPKRGPYPLIGTVRINLLPFSHPFPSPHPRVPMWDSFFLIIYFFNTRVSRPHPSAKGGARVPGVESRVKSGYGYAWLHL